MDDQYQLLTPENVEFSYDLAGPGSRFVAALVDIFIQSVIFALVGVATLVGAGTLGVLAASVFAPNRAVLAAWMIGGGLILMFLILWGYYIFFEVVWNGQSPGKRLFHIRVIREDGYPVTFFDSVVRNLVRVVDFLPVYYVVGFTVMLLNRRWKRLGDFVAGTVVVKERGHGVEPLWPAPDTSATAPARLDCARRLSAEDYATIREYLARAPSLPPERRRELAADLARAFATRLACVRGDLEDEAFLAALSASYERR